MDNLYNNNRVSTKHVNLKSYVQDDYSMKEAYKIFRTNLQFCGDDVHVIAVTSCMPNEGKSTISLELSKSLAELGKKVLLIDADLRKSVLVSKYADQTGIEGLSQFLSGQAALQDVLYSTQYPNFFVIFSGAFPPNPVELLSKTKFKDFIDNAKNTFDYIIIDCPPLGSVIDAAVIASSCDSSIMVISANSISAKFAKNVKNQLEKSGCRILGAVLNNVEDKGNGYYSKYYYQKYYRSYYGKYGAYGYGQEPESK
ncbi:MAG: CpsD/CapB family tyrosine-protein kinase [Ruminococcaceae bacterium]|nr:CpsD/CapB family tyrosine-protein kinase [Oscillospiraceae bacterium]